MSTICIFSSIAPVEYQDITYSTHLNPLVSRACQATLCVQNEGLFPYKRSPSLLQIPCPEPPIDPSTHTHIHKPSPLIPHTIATTHTSSPWASPLPQSTLLTLASTWIQMLRHCLTGLMSYLESSILKRKQSIILSLPLPYHVSQTSNSTQGHPNQQKKTV